MEYFKAVMLVIFAYLMGSVPWGFIIGKAKGIDVRTVGSKNIGATNVTRCVGKAAGKLCFALDFAKGALPVFAAQKLIGCGFISMPQAWQVYVVIAVLLATVLGHMFPVFLKFHGGKGVSTAAGAVVALAPVALLTALVVWVVVFLVSRYVSLASISAAAVLPVAAWVLYLIGFGSELARTPEVRVFLILIALLTIIRHRANIQRLLQGTENRFGKKSE